MISQRLLIFFYCSTTLRFNACAKSSSKLSVENLLNFVESFSLLFLILPNEMSLLFVLSRLVAPHASNLSLPFLFPFVGAESLNSSKFAKFPSNPKPEESFLVSKSVETPNGSNFSLLLLSPLIFVKFPLANGSAVSPKPNLLLNGSVKLSSERKS